MLLVGLSGGIGSGKSTVARSLAELGAVVIDSDVVAREVLAPGTEGLAQVAQRFGGEVIDADGALNRPALGRIVFAEASARAELEAITHPLIAERTAALVAEAGARDIVVHDVPLLVENGMGPAFHLVVMVHAPEEQRLRRLVDDRGMTHSDATARIRSQADEAARRAAADVWLENTGSATALRRRVEELWSGRLVPYEQRLHTRTPVRPPTASARLPIHTQSPPADQPGSAQAARLLARVRHVLGDPQPGTIEIATTDGAATPQGRCGSITALRILLNELSDLDPHLEDLARAGFFEVATTASARRLLLGSDPMQPTELHAAAELPCME